MNKFVLVRKEYSTFIGGVIRYELFVDVNSGEEYFDYRINVVDCASKCNSICILKTGRRSVYYYKDKTGNVGKISKDKMKEIEKNDLILKLAGII